MKTLNRLLHDKMNIVVKFHSMKDIDVHMDLKLNSFKEAIRTIDDSNKLREMQLYLMEVLSVIEHKQAQQWASANGHVS